MSNKILTINPGSTSTKVALFEDEKLVFKENISHDAAVLEKYQSAIDQFEYRKQTILNALKDHSINISDCDAVAGRGGGQSPCEGGIYEVNELMIEDSLLRKYDDHPACLGCLLANDLASKCNAKAYIVNPPTTDEFQLNARITGIKGVFRVSKVHALNHKETAIRVATDMELKYEQSNFIIAHIGGGVSVAAHKKGKIIDCNDIVGGDGPMAPTRCGSIAVRDAIDMCFSGKYTKQEMNQLLTKSGGFVSHLGTSDIRKVIQMIKSGDEYAKLIYEAFQYQIAKQIGAMAVVLGGKVAAIILTGGIVNENSLALNLKEMVDFIAPVEIRPGEFEMEALAFGALRALNGEEKVKIYTGTPTFEPDSLLR